MKAPKPAKESKQDEATPEKRRGRPPGSKSKNKIPKAAAERKTKKSKKGGDDDEVDADDDNQDDAKKDGEEEEVDEPSQESVEEGDEAPVTHSLSKEEIKAKIASRKTPSKKKLTTDDPDAKSKSGGAKKQAATTGKTSSGGGKTASSTDEIDTKRKKEIELVVPRKSVKSADIREMTEEAAKKKLDGGQQKEKTKKDKGEYKVGDLGAFASKLTRLNANESSKNNDEIIQMLNQLFEEKVVFRSDVERSGLAAIIAVLRKSSNPTVAQTASALRKHLMKIIRMDTGNDGTAAPAKPQKAADDSSKTASKKPKDAKSAVGGEKKDEPKKNTNGVAESKPVAVEADKVAPTTSSSDDKPNGDVKSNNKTSSTAPADSKETTTPVADAAKEVTPPKTEDDSSKTTAKAAEPAATEVAKSDSGEKKADASLDKNRQAFVDMLSNVLELSGPKHLALAKEIEVRS